MENSDFTHFSQIPEYLKKGLKSNSFLFPSDIQKQSLENYKFNIIAQSKNGTGKTLAFLLVVLANIEPKSIASQQSNCLECIILSPSRELALQTNELLLKITSYASPPIRTIVTIGGQPLKADIDTLKITKPQILVGSLGRVIHLVKEEIISLENIKEIVIDEADQMFTDKSFKFDMHGLISLLPKSCKKLVFSATYTTSLLNYLQNIINDSIFIKGQNIDEPNKIAEENKIFDLEKLYDIDEIQLKQIHQFYADIEKVPYFEEKLKLLSELLNKIKYKQCIIFCKQKFRAVEISEHLKGKSIKNLIIHGDLSMDERIQTINNMKKFNINVIISTDLVFFNKL